MGFRKQWLTSLVCLTLASCASQEAVHKEVKELQTGPSATPHKSITNFSSGLRCMDNMMIEYGVQDISMLVEDLEDQTSKVNAGTKDMLITAMSKMTRRSRAIKLIPFGNDSGNLISFLGAAGSQSAYSVIPQYDIRGSISQLDSSVVRKQVGASIAAEKWGLGASASTAGSILGVDLSVLSTQDLSVLHGVTSSNAVVLFQSGSGGDADATIKKSGISFDFQVARSEAAVQALRNLIELASIELVGRLVKVPYWQCLGIPADSPDIQQEMEDWHYSMQAHGELEGYVRSRLVARGAYPMEETDPYRALDMAIRTYQRAMQVPETGELDYALFELLLNGKSATTPIHRPDIVLAARIEDKPVKVEDAKDPIIPPKQTAPLRLTLRPAKSSTSFNRGETIALLANTNKAAYVYCYFIDAEQQIQRFFPNRFQANNFLAPGSSLRLPGKMPFDITADSQGRQEQVSCYATSQNIFHKLPLALRAYDFEPLKVSSANAIRDGFQAASNGEAAEARFTITVN